MVYREIIAVCSQIHTKHINTLCGQNVELLNVKLAVPIVTTGLWMVKVTKSRNNLQQKNRKYFTLESDMDEKKTHRNSRWKSLSNNDQLQAAVSKAMDISYERWVGVLFTILATISFTRRSYESEWKQPSCYHTSVCTVPSASVQPVKWIHEQESINTLFSTYFVLVFATQTFLIPLPQMIHTLKQFTANYMYFCTKTDQPNYPVDET